MKNFYTLLMTLGVGWALVSCEAENEPNDHDVDTHPATDNVREDLNTQPPGSSTPDESPMATPDVPNPRIPDDAAGHIDSGVRGSSLPGGGTEDSPANTVESPTSNNDTTGSAGSESEAVPAEAMDEEP